MKGLAAAWMAVAGVLVLLLVPACTYGYATTVLVWGDMWTRGRDMGELGLLPVMGWNSWNAFGQV